MLCSESFICELHEQTALAYTCITDDDVLEQKRIRH